jgi:hypothetical protein
MELFAEVDLAAFLEIRRQTMLEEIQTESANKVLNVNESDYVRYLANKYRIEPIVFHFESLQASHSEKLIPTEHHPRNYAVHISHSRKAAYPRQVITFHLQFSGDECLLKCRPSTLGNWSIRVSVAPNEIRFDLINWQNDVEALRQAQAEIIERIRQQNENVANDVDKFNSQLELQARQVVSGRKAILLKQLNVAEALGIPLRKAGNVPQTFAVPVTPKQLVVKPPSSDVSHKADPTLDASTYEHILAIIHDAGVGMERLPSTYANKQEEDLRDYLLIPLCTHYQNSTGETFNKKGKTDILIRHEGSNVFVGECKFWKGLKAFHETIDQILGYLTWRDSKAAILCFVNNKELNPVLEQISTGTPQHACFVRLESKKSESWLQFEFRLKSDPTRNVHLAVLCFHFPPK